MAHRLAASLLLAALLGGAGAAFAKASLYTMQEPWLDDTGRRVPLAQWRGRAVIVAMEYSACRFVCSAYWQRLQQVQAEADRRGTEIEFVILSIDPDNDSPASWREYRNARGLLRTNWHFLTGTRPQTTRAAGLLGVRWWVFEGHLMHDFKVVRLDADGAVAGAITGFDEPVDVVLGHP